MEGKKQSLRRTAYMAVLWWVSRQKCLDMKHCSRGRARPRSCTTSSCAIHFCFCKCCLPSASRLREASLARSEFAPADTGTHSTLNTFLWECWSSICLPSWDVSDGNSSSLSCLLADISPAPLWCLAHLLKAGSAGQYKDREEENREKGEKTPIWTWNVLGFCRRITLDIPERHRKPVKAKSSKHRGSSWIDHLRPRLLQTNENVCCLLLERDGDSCSPQMIAYRIQTEEGGKESFHQGDIFQTLPCWQQTVAQWDFWQETSTSAGVRTVPGGRATLGSQSSGFFLLAPLLWSLHDAPCLCLLLG